MGEMGSEKGEMGSEKGKIGEIRGMEVREGWIWVIEMGEGGDGGQGKVEMGGQIRGMEVRARWEGGYGVSDIREKTEIEENKDDLKNVRNANPELKPETFHIFIYIIIINIIFLWNKKENVNNKNLYF